MKKYLMLIIIFIVCGCSSKYSLDIKGEEITENVDFVIDKSLIVEENLSPDLSIYSTDSINYILNNELYPLTNSRDKIYEKNIQETDTAYEVNLNYIYEDDELVDSSIINQCFEKNDIIITNDKISIHLYGKFNCLNDTSDSMQFVIKTSNKIESANIDYSAFTKEFIWQIDNSNKNNVDIQIELSTETKFKYYGIRIGALVVGIVILIIGVYAAKVISNKEKANEI